MQSKLTDGEQVEPAPAKPVNVQVRKARESNWELARGYPLWPGINVCQLTRPDTREQSNLIAKEQRACKRGGVHTR
ncbi:MAG: hypothetical protein OEU36_21355, partial [Gammaproteobacteria bacterium]|nr:hypothetical protein [Gammaproteobacteria bacterium]